MSTYISHKLNNRAIVLPQVETVPMVAISMEEINHNIINLLSVVIVTIIRILVLEDIVKTNLTGNKDTKMVLNHNLTTTVLILTLKSETL